MIWIIAATLLLVVAVAATVVIRRRRSRQRTSVLKRVLASIAGVAAGIVIAVSGAGATYAYLNAQASGGAATLRAGTLGLTVSPISSTAFTSILPGETLQQTVTVTSTGDAPATVRVNLAAATSVVVRLPLGACTVSFSSTPPTGTALSTTASLVNDFTAGQARSYCLQVTAPASGLTAGGSYGFTLNFTSTQKTP